MGGKGGKFWGSCPPKTFRMEAGRKERSQCSILPVWSWQDQKKHNSQVFVVKNGKFLESSGGTSLENIFKVVFTPVGTRAELRVPFLMVISQNQPHETCGHRGRLWQAQLVAQDTFGRVGFYLRAPRKCDEGSWR